LRSHDDGVDGQSLSDFFGSTPTSPAMKMTPSLFMYDPSTHVVGDGDGADLKCVPPSTLSATDTDDDDVAAVLSPNPFLPPVIIKDEPDSLFSFTPHPSSLPNAAGAGAAVQSTTMVTEPARRAAKGGKVQAGATGARNRLHACSWCPKTFSTTGHLKQHTRIHTGDRPFECTWCNKAFAQCGDLKRHVRIHTGEKPFECTSCGKAFAQCGNLKKHERIHVRGGDSASPTPSDNSSSDGSGASVRPVKRARASVSPPALTAIGIGSLETIGDAAKDNFFSGSNLGDDDLGDDDLDDDADESRQERSRRNARESRMRKKEYVATLENRLAVMDASDKQLRAQLMETQLKLQQLQDEHNTLLERTQAAGLLF
jgi:hypothetical protein